jgi:hypothetical protein
MTMVHQHRVSIAAGAFAFLGLGAVALFGDFPGNPGGDAAQATAELGRELLGDSMLIFETAGVILLATMIGSLALASHRGRYGDAEEGSVEPALSPGIGTPAPVAASEPDMDEHAGHDMGGMAGHGGHG